MLKLNLKYKRIKKLYKRKKFGDRYTKSCDTNFLPNSCISLSLHPLERILSSFLFSYTIWKFIFSIIPFVFQKVLINKNLIEADERELFVTMCLIPTAFVSMRG